MQLRPQVFSFGSTSTSRMKPSVAQTGACFLLSFQTLVSAQLTYWVDQSCTNTPARQNAFNAAIHQAIDLANRGSQRLQSNTDTDMKDNIQRIFNTNWNNDANARNQINGTLIIESLSFSTNHRRLRLVRNRSGHSKWSHSVASD